MKIKMRMYALWLLPVIAISLFSCKGNRSGISEQEQDSYIILGEEISNVTGNTMASRLKSALGEGGVQNAVNYCNLVANPLVDSISKRYNAQIRRTTLQARNPDNIPAMNEKKVLLDYQEAFKSGKQLKARLEKLDDGRIAYYSPIMVSSPLCLNCHGEVGKNMDEGNYNLIKSLYPEDEATGYKEGDFRGMWSITFNM